MKEQTAKFLLEAGEAAGLDIDLHESYSGRGMMGKETWGVTTHNEFKLLAAAVAAAFERGEAMGMDEVTGMDAGLHEMEEIVDDLEGLRRDNMGMDVILY